MGEKILEVGCGSGRFTEQALETGAFVASMDYSNAVDVNYANNGPRDNLLVVQGDIYAIPFRRGWFDKLYCIGVIQHTPDPESAFLSLPPLLRDGGELVIDVYKRELRKLLSLKYWARPLTRRMQPEALYRATRRYVDIMWPLASRIRKIPKVGPMINWSLCVADHSRLGLTGELLKEWAYLDTFDMLSPRYDRPQSIRTVTSWFAKAGMRDVEVHDGYNGIEARGKRP